jgi:hypothetical protein
MAIHNVVAFRPGCSDNLGGLERRGGRDNCMRPWYDCMRRVPKPATVSIPTAKYLYTVAIMASHSWLLLRDPASHQDSGRRDSTHFKGGNELQGTRWYTICYLACQVARIKNWSYGTGTTYDPNLIPLVKGRDLKSQHQDGAGRSSS